MTHARTLYAERVREWNRRLIPSSCYRRIREDNCPLVKKGKEPRRPETLKEHIENVLSVADKIYPRFKASLTRLLRRALMMLKYDSQYISNVIGMADDIVYLLLSLHDAGKAVEAYQNPHLGHKYRHEYLSAVIVYDILHGNNRRHKFSIDHILSSHYALAVLLHHQPRTYEILEDYNTFLVTSSMIRESLQGLEEHLRILDHKIFIDPLKMRVKNQDLIDAAENTLRKYEEKPMSLDYIEEKLTLIQLAHLGLPSRYRRALRALTALLNQVIMAADNVAAYMGRAPHPECVEKCTPYTSIIYAIAYYT
jgi:CRISPR-associated endonuclease Cas3-HD